MNKNDQTKQNKEVYEAPKAEISKVSEVDVLTSSFSLKGPWDSQDLARNFNF